MPSRTAVTTTESYGQKKSRKPRVSMAAAPARVIRLAPRAASGRGPVCARAPEEVIAASLPALPVSCHYPRSEPDHQHPGWVKHSGPPAASGAGGRAAAKRGLPWRTAALDLAGVAACSAAGTPPGASQPTTAD